MSRVPKVLACVPRLLTRDKWPDAARNAIKVNPANRPPDLDESNLHQGGEGERLALDITRYWGQGAASISPWASSTRPTPPSATVSSRT